MTHLQARDSFLFIGKRKLPFLFLSHHTSLTQVSLRFIPWTPTNSSQTPCLLPKATTINKLNSHHLFFLPNYFLFRLYLPLHAHHLAWTSFLLLRKKFTLHNHMPLIMYSPHSASSRTIFPTILHT